MHKSEGYKTMCEKSQQIQDQWKHSKRSSGDWYYNIKLNAAYVVSDEDQDDIDCIWLPTQEQLQDMCRHGNTTCLELVNRLAINAKGIDYLFYKYNWTMEQLWIALYMKQEHGQIWNESKEIWTDIPLSMQLKNIGIEKND